MVKMAEKPGNKIINVLVLGTSGVQTMQFVKLFGIYLQHDSYEESKMWEAGTRVDEDINGISTSIILVDDKKIKLTCIPCDKYVQKQVIQFMIHFMKGQKFSAIIYLVNPSEEKDIWVHKTCLFSKLKNFPNILNVVSLNKDCYNYEQFIDCTCRKERSEFYLEEDTFYSISKENWQQSMDFCKKILESIAGYKCGLQYFCIQSVILEKSLIKLERDLLELLMLIYISGECYNICYSDYHHFGFIIKNYKKKVTTCYGNKCVTWMKYTYFNDYKMKIPRICHDPCKCAESVNDVSKCMILDTPDKLCLKCNCSSDLHSNNNFYITSNYFTKDLKADLTSINKEKHIAINNLATFFLHNKQHQEINFEDIFLKLGKQHSIHKPIFDTFKKEFNNEVQKLENDSNPINCENVLMCIKGLYQIEKITKILPQFLQEIFPDFDVEVTTDDTNEPNKEATSKIPKFKSEKMENEMLRKENAELRLMLQNSNDLNSKLIQDMHALTKQRNLNQTEEDTKEN